jgi:prepilin-type processing-associated H-X9-DG protein
MLACANAADLPEGFLPADVGPYKQGTRLAESFTDGPVDPATMRAPSGTSTNWQTTWTRTKQDYRDFGPVHGGSSGSCNILFLDGSVRSFIDKNGDGFLNNGFTSLPTNGFADEEIELPAAEVYSGWSLNSARMLNN